MFDQTSDIIQIIESYTDQIARYEILSTWYAAFCAICIFLTLVLALWIALHRKHGLSAGKFYTLTLSGTFLIIPVITTLYLYTFSMNMRKVAIYRGYLSFLEQKWNVFAGAEILMFDNRLVQRFLSFDSFYVNGLGPAVMAVFVLLTLALGFGLALRFLRQLPSSREKFILQILVGILAVICVSFNGLCTYYLSINDRVVESVVTYCEECGGGVY